MKTNKKKETMGQFEKFCNVYKCGIYPVQIQLMNFPSHMNFYLITIETCVLMENESSNL